ncbi:hypothetical protein [Nocardia sp. NPDC060249]|uniref:hypothetical protein n=1 Tax=Nocardia sp. NPDC060249 TaxID=3347082 RepID=UPI003646BAC5
MGMFGGVAAPLKEENQEPEAGHSCAQENQQQNTDEHRAAEEHPNKPSLAMRCWSNPILSPGGNLYPDDTHLAGRNPLEDRFGAASMPDLFTLTHAARLPQNRNPSD